MKNFLNSWRGLVALVMFIALAGCTPAVLQPTNLSKGVAALTCSEVNTAKVIVNDLASAPADSGRRKELKNWGLDPNNQDQVKKVLDELNARAEACKTVSSVTASPSATATPSASASAGQGGDTQVGTADGQTVTLPWVSGTTVDNGDTRSNAQMPSIHTLLPNCVVSKTWSDQVACVNKNDAKWYIDTVNRFAPRSGFTWDDVVKWSTAKTADGKVPEQRVIMLTGTKTMLTDTQANDAVKSLTDGDTLQVIRLKQDGYTNTWRNKVGTGIHDFADYNDEVRVSLAPLVLDANGNVVGLNSDRMFSGVFVDCYNIHWLDAVTPTKPASPVCPTGTDLSGQPLPSNGYAGCTKPKPNLIPTPAKSCPPGQHGTYPVCKDDPSAGPEKTAVPTQVKEVAPAAATSASAPAVPKPVAAYTPPPAPPAPSTTTTTSAPAPAPGANTPVASATACVPAPGKTTC